VITKPEHLGGLYSCTDHPELAADEVAAAMHLRTVHSEMWQKLAGLSVEPVALPRTKPEPSRRTAPARPRKLRRPDRRRRP
jgi:hypothetical protein